MDVHIYFGETLYFLMLFCQVRMANLVNYTLHYSAINHILWLNLRCDAILEQTKNILFCVLCEARAYLSKRLWIFLVGK